MNNEFENQAEESVKPMECEPRKGEPHIVIIGGDSAAGLDFSQHLSELYPLDWKTMDVALADGRYVHTISRPASELILKREMELNQDIEIDKKGGYALPNPTETEDLDARFYEQLNPSATGYVGAIPELHKATVFQSTLERNIYVAEECDVYGDEIRVIEEVGSGDEPDFVINHFLRGASEAEVKAFRRKNNNRKIERARNGRQKLVQSSPGDGVLSIAAQRNGRRESCRTALQRRTPCRIHRARQPAHPTRRRQGVYRRIDRQPVGLTETLAEHFAAHIDCQNQNDGESCPGSEACRTTRGKPLYKYGSQQPEEEICAGCQFLPTKMEAIPEEIIEFVGISLELTELEKSNAKFDYPQALTPLEWHCLRGLTRGRDRAESLKQERDRKERKLNEAKARLNK